MAGVAIAVAHEQGDGPSPSPPRAESRSAASCPRRRPASRSRRACREPDRDTTRRLRDALAHWDPATPVPREVTYLALRQQRILRLMAARRALGDAALALLPADVRAEARDTVLGRRALAAIPRSPGRLPRVRVAQAAPAAQLRALLRRGAAAVRHRLVGPGLGELRRVGVRPASAAPARPAPAGRCSSCRRPGARSAWAARSTTRTTRSSPPRTCCTTTARRATSTGRSSPTTTPRRTCARSGASPRRMHTDERAFLTYYAWQVFVRTRTGVQRITGPGRATPH